MVYASIYKAKFMVFCTVASFRRTSSSCHSSLTLGASSSHNQSVTTPHSTCNSKPSAPLSSQKKQSVLADILNLPAGRRKTKAVVELEF